jgi:hypothetical protein
MADTIEISNNTLLKLKVRSGTDLDRKGVVLDVGELGYTTDHNRLYVGDATTGGGRLVGNLYNGARSGVTNSGFAIPHLGDYAYDTSNRTLYIYRGGPTAEISSWQQVSYPVTASDSTITISSGQIKVNKIFANNLDSGVVGSNLQFDNVGRITLQETITVNRIESALPNLTIPAALEIGNVQYTFPATLSADGFLQTDGSGNLAWSSINTILCSASAAVLSVGEGLTLTVNDEAVTETQLLTSSNVKISGIHLPVASCSFKQDSTVVRSAAVSTVEVEPGSTILNEYAITHNGMPFTNSTSIYDNTAGTGVYKIVLDDTYLVSNSEVEIFTNNASYFKETTGLNRIIHISPHLECSYQIVPDISTPTNFNTIIVYFYATSSKSFLTNKTWSTQPTSPILTPGYNNASTRFQVNVYGDLAP